MGLNISVRKIISKEEDETWGGRTVVYYNTEQQNWFDTCRHSGDREFAREVNFTPYDKEQIAEEVDYYRPKNITEAIEWVNNNVVECNKHRLLTALEKMQQDKDLVFSFSY